MLVTYLLSALIIGVIQAKLLYDKSSTIPSSSPVFLLSLAVKRSLLLLEPKDQGSYLKPSYQRLSVELTSDIINRSFLWWLDGLILEGSEKLMLFQDLYELDQTLAASPLENQIQSSWDQR